MPRRSPHPAILALGYWPRDPSHPLWTTISHFRIKIWGAWVGLGALKAAGGIVGTGFLLGVVDSILRIDEPIFRMILSVGWFFAAGASLYLFVLRRVFSYPTEVEIARLLERRHPQLRDQLAAATEFSGTLASKEGGSSPELRQAVVNITWDNFQKLKLEPLVARWLWWHNAGLLGTGLVLIFVCLLFWPSMVVIGGLRLILPWEDIRWPQRFHLTILRPVPEVVQGGDFEVAVVDREGKRLPPGGRMWFKTVTPEGRVLVESAPLTYLDPETAVRRLDQPKNQLLRGGVWIARREAIDSPFWFRAEAGDDRSMPWFYVRTAAAPRLRSLSARVFFPSYTGWPELDFPGPVAALEGSRILLRGESTKPLSQGLLVVEKQGNFSANLEDPMRFVVEFVAQETTSFWFQLVDTAGLSGGESERWQLRVFPDAPPRVSIRTPGWWPRVTPQARVPVQIELWDDVGVREAQLQIGRKEGETPTNFVVYQGPPFPRPPGKDFILTGPTEEKHSIIHHVDFEALKLSAGQQITLMAKVQDYRGQSSESSPIVLEVITPEELRGLLSEQERSLLGDLRRALEVQEKARRLASEEKTHLLSETTPAQDLESGLESTLWTQREVPRILTDSSESVAERAGALLLTLSQNRVEDSQVFERLNDLRTRLRELKAGPLFACEEGILAVKRAIDWLKAENRRTDNLAAKRQEALRELEKVLDSQDTVIESLKDLIARFHVSDSLRELQRELAELTRSQWEVYRRSLEQARNTAGRSVENLSAAERATLRSLAEEQRQIGDRFQRFTKALRDWVANFPTGATPPESLAGAAQLASRLEGRGTIPRTASDLAENRMGQALRQQQEVLGNFEEIARLLQEDPRRTSPPSPKIPPELAEALHKLVREQQAVRKEFEQAVDLTPPAQTDKLAEAAQRQQTLRSQLEALKEKFPPEVQTQVGPKAETVTQEMAKAASKAQENQAGQALEHARVAEKLLGEVYEDLAGQPGGEMLATAERMIQLYRELVTLLEAQKGLTEQTADLHRRLASPGEPGRRELLQILALADRQENLRQVTEELPIPAEARLLKNTQGKVGKALLQAEQGLRNRETGPVTQQAQRRALALLEQMIAALTPPEPTPETNPASQTPTTPTTQETAPPKDQIPPNPYLLIELRLLRNLQEELKSETAEFIQQHGETETLPEEVRQKAEELRREQENLSQLLIELLKSAIEPTIQIPSEESVP